MTLGPEDKNAESQQAPSCLVVEMESAKGLMSAGAEEKGRARQEMQKAWGMEHQGNRRKEIGSGREPNGQRDLGGQCP